MSRRILIWVAILAALVVVAVLVGATLQLLGNPRMLASGLSELTGREIRLEAPAKLRPGLVPGLQLEGVTVGPAEGSALRSARIGRLELVLALWPLVRGDFEVRRLEVDDAQVVLELAAADAAGAETGADTPDETWERLSLRQADVRNLKLEIRRDGAAAPTTAHLERVSVRSPDEGRAVEVRAAGEVEAIRFDLGGRYDASAAASDPSTPPSSELPSIELDGTLAGAHVSGRGSLDLSSQRPSLALRVQAEAPDVQTLSPVAQRDLPPVGPVQISGLVEVRGETLGVSDLDLQIGSRDSAWLEVTGHVGDIANQRDFSLRSEFGFDDVRVLAPLVRDPPHIGRIVGKASVHDVGGPPRVEEFTLRGGRPGVFEIDAEGHFDDVKRVHGLDARVDLKARDLAVLGELLHRTLPAVAPVEFSGRVTAHEGELSADQMTARLDRTRFRGSVAGKFEPDGRPRVTAKLEVPELHLDDLGIEPEPDSGSPETPGQRVFTDTPLDFAWTRVADGQLALRAGRVLGVGGPLAKDLELDGRLEQGRLSLRYAAPNFEGGATSASLELDARASPPTLVLTARAKSLDLGRLVEQIDVDKAWSGLVDAKLDLRSRGASPRALAAGLGGEILVSCGGGTIATAHAGLLTRDLLHSVRRVALKERTTEVLNCLIVEFEFEEGRGTARTLVVDAEDIVIVGEGEIDLGNETVDLRLVPRPRRSGLFSTAATVQVSGPITSPAVKVQKGSLVTSATAALVKKIGSATGTRRAWGILAGGASDRSPCAKLVGSTP